MIILNETKIKYDKLDIILKDQLESILFSQQVNIIIDLKEVIKKFFRPGMIQEFKNRAEIIQEISSDLINIVAHYRNYFYKKAKYSNFFVLYSFDKCENIINEHSNYKSEYYHKYFDGEDEDDKIKIEITKSSIKVMQSVLKYVPNCNFIETSKYDELVYSKFILDNTNNNELNLILSNDPIMFQLLNKHTFIINLKGIKSDLITSENCISKNIVEGYNFSSNLYPLILSFAGNKKYNIESVFEGVAEKKALKIIKSLLEREIVEDKNSIEIPINFSKLDLSNKMDMQIYQNKDKIIENFNLIRNDELYYKNKLNITAEFASLPKTSNSRRILELNAKIFTLFPLQLDMLFKGENLC